MRPSRTPGRRAFRSAALWSPPGRYHRSCVVPLLYRFGQSEWQKRAAAQVLTYALVANTPVLRRLQLEWYSGRPSLVTL